MRDRKLVKGWIHQTPGVPSYILVQMNKNSTYGQIIKFKETFPNDQEGAVQAAEWISKELGRDDWKLENMEFLGHRIIILDKEEENEG